MTPPEYDSEQEVGHRRQSGTGLAARFTIRLGLMTLLIAGVAGFLFLQGAEKLNRDAAAEARLEMAKTSSAVLARRHQMNASPLPEISGKYADAGFGAVVSYAKGPVALDGGQEELRIYQLRPGEGIPTISLFAPATDDSDTTDQLLVLVVLVLGGLVVMTVVFGAMTSRRVAEPLRTMIDDVMAISRGRYDRHIHAEGAASEVAFLARAVDRMVHDLVEGQETQRKLDKSQREAESMRELRRNLQPMTVIPPSGFSIETCLIEAAGAGTGDFVDAMTDPQGFSTLVVGSTATRGMPGALLMAMTRAYLRGAVLQGGSPAEACESTNISLNRDLAEGLYASAMVARLSPESEGIELVSSGHKAPAIRWDAEHEEFRKIQPNGIALGFDEGPVFLRSLETAQIQLHTGDALFLFSPGAFECTNEKGKKLGENGVYQLARYAIEHDLKLMEGQLLKYIGGKPRSDLAFALLRDVGEISA